MANELFLKNPKTIQKDLRCAVNKIRCYIQRSWNTAISKVPIVCDAWTSPNGDAIWGIRAQYLDSKFDLQCVTIGLERLWSSHDGRTLASVTHEVIGHYGKSFERQRHALGSETASHTLFWTCDKIGRLYIDAKNMLPADGATGWRMFGSLEKLHNLVMYVQASSQRHETLKAFTDELNLHRDNTTKWNSWWIAMDRAL